MEWHLCQFGTHAGNLLPESIHQTDIDLDSFIIQW